MSLPRGLIPHLVFSQCFVPRVLLSLRFQILLSSLTEVSELRTCRTWSVEAPAMEHVLWCSLCIAQCRQLMGIWGSQPLANCESSLAKTSYEPHLPQLAFRIPLLLKSKFYLLIYECTKLKACKKVRDMKIHMLSWLRWDAYINIRRKTTLRKASSLLWHQSDQALCPRLLHQTSQQPQQALLLTDP